MSKPRSRLERTPKINVRKNFRHVLNRKKRRKEERRALKQRKYEHHMKKMLSTKDPDLKIKKDKNEKVGGSVKKKFLKEKPSEIQGSRKLLNVEKKIQLSAQNLRKQQLMEANKDEDKTIKRLEKSLKLNRRKSKTLPKSFFDDGLGYVLEILDNSQSAGPSEGETFHSDEDDDGLHEDLANIAGTKSNITKKPVTKSHLVCKKSNASSSADHVSSEDSNTRKSHGNKNISKSDDNDSIGTDIESSCEENVGGENDDNIDSDDSNNDNKLGFTERSESVSDSSKPKKKKKLEYLEDIYGRLRDKEGNIVKIEEAKVISSGTYIPPAKRHCPGTEDGKKKEELDRIRRQIKGLLNRLSEANIQPIARQIEEMYMKHSRNDLNNTLTQLIFEVVVCHSLTPERLVMEHGMLIALLHANVGSEVGAYLLQSLATKYQDLQEHNGEGKECDNLLTLLAYLYNFKVTHSVLVYDMLHLHIKNFQEKDVELIILLLRIVGFNLRKDDPLALKEVVLEIQKQAATVSTQQNQSRLRFMLEILTAIRNNNMYKIPNYDPSLFEHVKKRVRGMLNKGCYIQELRISLEDLLKAEEKGRWWIVGSAWTIDEQSSKKENVSSTTDTRGHSEVPMTSISEKIVNLAKKQRMNTDVRKNIFCIIMTSEDYMDAFEKLLHLGLKNQQEREIIYVILDCCLQEKQFNPFYPFLAEKFCKFDRQYQIVLQFALWDKFKELSSLKSWHLNNLADLLAHLFTSGALPLSVLKVIHFADMKKTLVHFLRRILLPILLQKSEEVCCIVFQRIALAPNMNLLREGLRLFMHHFLLRNKDKLDSNTAEQLTNRIRVVEKILTSAKKMFTV